MKKLLKEWCEKREYVKVTLVNSQSVESRSNSYAGFLLDFDKLGITISRSHTKDMMVLIPWTNITAIQLWGNK